MPQLLAPVLALELVASVAPAPCALDHAQLLSLLPEPLAGASHG